MDAPVITYGPGGSAVPNNIVEQKLVAVPDEAVNADALAAKAANAIAALEFADNNWATITAAQKDTATRLAVRVSAKLARLTVGRLEAQ